MAQLGPRYPDAEECRCKGLIYVTHRLEEIPKGIERVLRLEAGKVVEA